MGFQRVSSKVHFPHLEERILAWWREQDMLRQVDEARRNAPLYVLYEGPPTANGSPGVHHVLARIFKDLFPRYKTMRGYRPFRKGGWDTHGLPVELEVEKELKLTSKSQIEAYGIDRFNARCRESVFRYVKEWEALTERIAFWIDMSNAYITLTNEYIETCWWLLKTFADAGLLYQGIKSTPHCPRCVTSLSSHEVALGYREDTPDPSVYVQFPLADTPQTRALVGDLAQPTFIVAWTTTPWTLPGNTAVAVHPEATYALVEVEGYPGRLILAADLASQALQRPYRIVKTFAGHTLRGLRYYPLYDPFQYEATDKATAYRASRKDVLLRLTSDGSIQEVPKEAFEGTYPVITADFVSLAEGTGVVHIAPAFGAEDYEVGKAEGLYFVQQVDLQGVVQGAYPFAGRFVKEADPLIIQDLTRRGLLYRHAIYRHTYPFCWRCDTPLLYYAKPSWYLRTTAVKDLLLRRNQEISWHPEHIRDGRFGEWLRNNVDWALSRERYWGTPLPVWRCGDCPHWMVMGSLAEVRAHATPDTLPLLDAPDLDLHRPYVDRFRLRCPQCGGTMTRVPEVLDCWFDSGAMPYAQFHYPFSRPTLPTDGLYPADYICEAVDQTRGWFYSLHAIACLLEYASKGQFTAPCYRHVICLGLVLDEKGEKMSKSRGNVVNPWSVINQHGADATRWYLFTATPPGSDRRFSVALVGEAVRRFLLILWNTYNFFTTYAVLDGFDPTKHPNPGPRTVLDRWLLAELHALVEEVTQSLEAYDPTTAARRLEAFVDLLSTWYVRRNRRRFWKTQSDTDKLAAFHTLYTCLETLTRLLAPFTPFVAEAMYQNLVRSVDPTAPLSVHLASWPTPHPAWRNPELQRATKVAMTVVRLGRAARSKAGIRVRMPLEALLVKLPSAEEASALHLLADEVQEELNVKRLEVVGQEEAFVTWTARVRRDLLGATFGARAEGAAQALARLPEAQVVEAARAGRFITAEGFTIPPEAIDVVPQDKPGFSAVVEGGYGVAVTTTLTPALRQEGLARELVHRLQDLRRRAGLEVDDRIHLWVEAPPAFRPVLEGWRDYIAGETLALQLEEGPPPPDTTTAEATLDGVTVRMGLRKAAEGTAPSA
ncbi:MAG: isoleucine--tRNA ligase [Dehalococcoidia bacterium]|nr:isoleucine--tRNA ligase [Dehalococcoidia bacterium]MDW8119823.1 isoleucine--tRNA ligase [Chloroflexota bacterium]